jgi:thiol-disulfide isomerase/thioredoxin
MVFGSGFVWLLLVFTNDLPLEYKSSFIFARKIEMPDRFPNMIETMKPLLILLFVLTSSSLFAQQGYNLQFKITGLQDTTVLLGFYYGESTYVKDTAKVNSKGEFTFDGKEPLKNGVYFLVLDKTRIFEMVIGSTQKFKMETSTADYVKNMKVIGDPDNKIFFENMLFNMEMHKEAEPHIAVIRDSTLNEDQKKSAREEYEKINSKVLAYHDDVIKKYPGTMTSKIFLSGIPVKSPEPPKKADGLIDSTFQLRWYREHFFDNFDLADDGLLRLPRPVYKEKITEYLDRLFVPQADTVNKAIDQLIAKAKSNKDTYQYIVLTLILKYQNPEIMGMDGVFVHLYDKYFATGEADYWANDKFKKNVKEYADRLRKSLVGVTAPNLIMQDANFQPRSMYDIKNKYTILFIFDPDCGHCKTETPILVDFYNKNRTKFNIEVYAVSADTSIQKMRDYIREMKMPWITVNGPRTYVGPYQDLYDAIQTPSLFILNEKKKIIAKKIPTEKLEDFFINYEKHHP